MRQLSRHLKSIVVILSCFVLCGSVPSVVNSHCSYCAYIGDIVFLTVVLSRICAEHGILPTLLPGILSV